MVEPIGYLTTASFQPALEVEVATLRINCVAQVRIGFVTGYLENMTSYLMSSGFSLHDPFPVESNFITIILSAPNQDIGLSPGEYDRKLLDKRMGLMLRTVQL